MISPSCRFRYFTSLWDYTEWKVFFFFQQINWMKLFLREFLQICFLWTHLDWSGLQRHQIHLNRTRKKLIVISFSQVLHHYKCLRRIFLSVKCKEKIWLCQGNLIHLGRKKRVLMVSSKREIKYGKFWDDFRVFWATRIIFGSCRRF